MSQYKKQAIKAAIFSLVDAGVISRERERSERKETGTEEEETRFPYSDFPVS